MLGIDHRAARVTWTVFLVLVAIATLWALRGTLLVFTFAILLAYFLSPAVILVNRLALRRASRTFSMAVVYIAMLAATGAVIGVVASRAASEAAALASTLPKYVENPPKLENLPLPGWIRPYQDQIVETLRQKLEEEARQIVPMLAHAGKGALSAIGNIVFLVLTPILSFFFLKDGEAIRDAFMARFARPERRQLARRVTDRIHHLLEQFMKAMVLLGFATFLSYSAVLGLLGLPYSLLLSVLAGAVEFIPVAGPLTASLIIITVAVVTGYQGVAGIIVFLIVYRLFLDYVLQPWIMGEGLELHPLAIIFGILAGEHLGGVAGMVLAIPVLASLRAVFDEYRRAPDPA